MTNILLKKKYPKPFGFIHVFFILVLLICVNRSKPITYARLNFIHQILLSFIFIISLIISIYISIEEHQKNLLIALLTSGIFLTLIYAILRIRKLKTLLKEIKPDTVRLFRFAFKINADVKLLEQHIKNQQKRVEIGINKIQTNMKRNSVFISDSEKFVSQLSKFKMTKLTSISKGIEASQFSLDQSQNELDCTQAKTQRFQSKTMDKIEGNQTGLKVFKKISISQSKNVPIEEGQLKSEGNQSPSLSKSSLSQNDQSQLNFQNYEEVKSDYANEGINQEFQHIQSQSPNEIEQNESLQQEISQSQKSQESKEIQSNVEEEDDFKQNDRQPDINKIEEQEEEEDEDEEEKQEPDQGEKKKSSEDWEKISAEFEINSGKMLPSD